MSHFLFVLLYIYSKSASPKPFDIRRTKKITVTIKVIYCYYQRKPKLSRYIKLNHTNIALLLQEATQKCQRLTDY